MINNELINKVAYGFVDEENKSWELNIHRCDWVAGVGLYGMCAAHQKTNSDQILGFLKKWVNMHNDELTKELKVNTMCLFYPYLYLYEATGEERYFAECVRAAEYMMNDAPKTKEGALEHTVIEKGFRFVGQIWADTLFMAVLLIAKMGKYDKKYSDFAKEQLILHLKYLHNDENNLFYHAWNGVEQNHMSAVCWGRANAWIMYSAAEISALLDEKDAKYIAEKYIEPHCISLAKLQRKNGSFGTVLDDETSYDEASATAGIIAGIKFAIEHRLIGADYEPICTKGAEYLLGCINENGGVENVSYGTPVFDTVQKYKDVKCKPSLYGQGLAAAALCINA